MASVVQPRCWVLALLFYEPQVLHFLLCVVHYTAPVEMPWHQWCSQGCPVLPLLFLALLGFACCGVCRGGWVQLDARHWCKKMWGSGKADGASKGDWTG